jgi:hypothetical protein
MHLPDDAAHRLAQALESGDPHQALMRLSAEDQGIRRQHYNNPQAAQAEMGRVYTAANREAAQQERAYGLQLVQFHPHRTYDGRMVLGVGRFTGSGWENWDEQARTWVRGDNLQTMPGTYAAPPVDRFAPVSPLLSRPGVTAPYDWSRWDRSSVDPDATVYGDNQRIYRARDNERERAYLDRDLDRYRDYRDRDRDLDYTTYRDPDLRYRQGLDPDDRIRELYAIERRIQQEQIQLERMIQQVTAQEQWLAQQQQRSGYAGAYAPGYAPNYTGRYAGGWEQYRTPDWRHRNPQAAYGSQMAQWQQYQQMQQWQQYQQYANQYQYGNQPIYASYQQPGYYPYNSGAYGYGYNPAAYAMAPMLQLAFGGRGRGFRIGAIL